MATTHSPFTPQWFVDGTTHFEAGMNSGIAPLLLSKSQLAFAQNASVRSTFVGPRPAVRKIALNISGDTGMAAAIKKGLWQGACHFKPDSGAESLMAAISGRLFRFEIGAASATVTDETIPGDPNPPNKVQAFLWQSEKWVVWMDGQSRAIFFDQTATPTSRRSNYNTAVPQPTTTGTTATWVVPARNTTVAGVNIVDITNLVVGDIVTVKLPAPSNYGVGTFQVVTITPGAPNTVDLLNLTGSPIGYTVSTTAIFSWSHQGSELPPGRVGTYGMCRNWLSLVDGKQFVASDLVGGSSGTVANNYRDAVLSVTENTYLIGGGNFTVPGSVGEIRAMIFAATLDASLGQGPLQVFTPKVVFSCNAPVDRLTWQDLTNPILTESLISNGALGHNSTVAVNGDTIFRAIDGIRSLVLGRRDFDTWGNVPISTEMDRILAKDDPGLLQYSSAIVFDNRLLMTASPTASNQGVYHPSLIALNFDPISTLRGKADSVYDGHWLGLNILQLVKGEFGGVERAFAFTLDTTVNEIELWEILRDEQLHQDNDQVPIVWAIETPLYMATLNKKTVFDVCRLTDGEMSIKDLRGPATIEIYFRPDEYPCWVPWTRFTVCAQQPDPTRAETANYQVAFKSRIGFGEPSPKLCETFTNRPFREGYYFQLRLVIHGFCRIAAIRLKSVTIPDLQFAPPVCDTPC